MQYSIIIIIFCFTNSLVHGFVDYRNTEEFAQEADRLDPLQKFRDEFYFPTTETNDAHIYLCGHSLGLQPKKTTYLMEEELKAWATLGVEGHFKSDSPWYTYHTLVQNSLATITGAFPHEVVAMNSLTVNIHLMFISFYKPTKSRYKVLMEAPVFSSDTYAVKSEVQLRGYDPDSSIIIVSPRKGEDLLRIEDVMDVLDNQGDEIALVFFNGVNYLTGQFVDMERITKKAHDKGCLVGFDLAHAIGNVPLKLHDWDVDFATWCSYKYLNAGPGAIGGAYIHEKHCQNDSLLRLAGWWGNNPDTRFSLHLQPDFVPVKSADSWQLSNPSILALVPLRASLELFDKAGIEALREKSKLLTGYLEYLINDIGSSRVKIITPADKEQRGCSLSILVEERPEELLKELNRAGISCDFRRPNILRITPIPLYNTFYDVWQFAEILKNHLAEG